MKTIVRRSCGHEEKIKIYQGVLKQDIIVSREALKTCRKCKAEKKA